LAARFHSEVSILQAGSTATGWERGHGFLKDHGVYLNYAQEDLEHDMETLRRLGDQEHARG